MTHPACCVEVFYRINSTIRTIPLHKRSSVPRTEITGVERRFGPRVEVDRALHVGGTWADMHKNVQSILDRSPESTSWDSATGKTYIDTKEDIKKDLSSCLRYVHDTENDRSFIARADPEATTITRGFYWFPDRKKFSDNYNILNETQKVFHEVVKKDNPRKAVFDIDAYQGEIDSRGVTRDEIFTYITSSIKTVFNKLYGCNITDDNLVVCDSSNEKKFSRHVLVKGYHFENNPQFGYFLLSVARHLRDTAPKCSAFLDIMATRFPYSSLRILGCHKPNDPLRVKRLITPAKATDTLITFIPKSSQSVGVPDELVIDDNVEAGITGDIVIDAMMDILENDPRIDSNCFRIRGVNGGMIALHRMQPSFCPICKRDHDREGMYVYRRGSTVFAQCFASGHQIDTKNSDPLELGTLPWSGSMLDAAQFHHGDVAPPMKGLVQPLPNPTVLDENEIQDIEFPDESDTLIIRSSVGTGKTKALVRYIEREKPEKILVVSFRKAFTNEMKGKLNDFLDYRNIDVDLELERDKRIIVQFESLHRVVAADGTPDLLILDEIESILDQSEHGIMIRQGTLQRAISSLSRLMKNAVKVVAMDAFLSQRSVNFIELFRTNITSIDNEHRSRSDHKFVLVDEPELFMRMSETLKANKCAVLVSCTKRFANGAYEYFSEYFPSKKIKIYTGDNSCEKSVQEELLNVNEAWKDVDLLIYTSTILAGCSFERKHFDYGFGYFTNNTVSAQGCFQMLQRVRDISSKTYIIAFPKSMTPYPKSLTDREHIENSIQWHFDNVGKRVQKGMKLYANEAAEMSRFIPLSSISIDEDDEHLSAEIKKDWWYKTHISNLVARGMSRRYFINEFVRLLKVQGCPLYPHMCQQTDDTKNKEKKEWSDTISKSKEVASIIDGDAIAAAPVPTVSKKNIILSINGINSKEDRLMADRCKLALEYRIPEEAVTSKLYTECGRPAPKRIFTNLSDITKKSTIGESLSELKNKTNNEYMNAKSNSSKMTLSRNAERHQLVIDMLIVLGFDIREWKCPHSDSIRVFADDVMKTLNTGFVEFLRKRETEFGVYFSKNISPDDFAQKKGTAQMNIVNGILRTIYGIHLNRAGGWYTLSLKAPFIYDDGRYWPKCIYTDVMKMMKPDDNEVKVIIPDYTSTELAVDEAAKELEFSKVTSEDDRLIVRAASKRTGVPPRTITSNEIIKCIDKALETLAADPNLFDDEQSDDDNNDNHVNDTIGILTSDGVDSIINNILDSVDIDSIMK